MYISKHLSFVAVKGASINHSWSPDLISILPEKVFVAFCLFEKKGTSLNSPNECMSCESS